MGSVEPSTHDLLEGALHDAVATYSKKHAASKKSHDEACLYMPGGNTRTVLYASPYPFTVESAHSCYLNTADNIQYIDFLGEYTAGIYGHNHPAIRKAVEDALEGGWNYGGHSGMESRLAKVICERFPCIEMVRFVNSGTEANMMVLATALAVSPTKGKKVLIFEKGYHGSTISGLPSSSAPIINLPHDFVVGQYNDIDGTKNLIQSLPSGSLAAILVEPMIGGGGCFPASPEFLQVLRDLATHHKALLIFDEVMTSRLSYHGLGEVYGIRPDMMTLGKYLGGGMTFGAFGGRDDIMLLYDPRKGQLNHPGTFNNNVFTMHAGVAGAEILTPDVLKALNGKGEMMKTQLEAVLEELGISTEGEIPIAPLVHESKHKANSPQRPPKMFIKGVGSMMTIHFAGPDRESLQALFYHHMLEEGIYIAQRGFIALNIEIKDEYIQKFVGAVTAFCRQYFAVLQW